MRTENAALAFLVVILLVAGGIGWVTTLQPALQPRAETLAGIPYRLGPYEGEDTAIDDAVESMLRADYNVQRSYRTDDGGLVWLYLGYYGTARGGTPEHVATCEASHTGRELQKILA